MDLLQHVTAFCAEHQLIATGDTIVVGVSGGPDSLALLTLLRQMALDFNLTLHVAHLNHGLRGPDADADAAFVAHMARQWQLPITIEKINVAALAEQKKQTLEEAARYARYAFLHRVARRIHAPKIAVGHNANDQTETVLFHLLRGTGIAGLGGMLPATRLTGYAPPESATLQKPSPPLLIRPLLNTPRDEIETFCNAHSLTPRIDHSNQDQAFFRNRIRHELLPLLETYNPNIHQALRRTASLVAADNAFLDEETERAWRLTVKAGVAHAVIFDWQDWQPLPLAMQRRVLRKAIQQLSKTTRNIDFAPIEQARCLLHSGRTGSQLSLPHGLTLVLGYNTFTLATSHYTPPAPTFPHLATNTSVSIVVPGNTPLSEAGGRWYIQTTLLDPRHLSADDLSRHIPWQAYFDAAAVGQTPTLRTRRPGDRFAPYGLNGHTQRLKKYMIDQKIPAHQRASIPLLVSKAGEICWVCGWRTSHHSRVTPDTRHVLSVAFVQKQR